jgi:hypothetical protein
MNKIELRKWLIRADEITGIIGGIAALTSANSEIQIVGTGIALITLLAGLYGLRKMTKSDYYPNLMKRQ